MIQIMPADHNHLHSLIIFRSANAQVQNIFDKLLSSELTSSLISRHKRFDYNAENFDVVANDNVR